MYYENMPLYPRMGGCCEEESCVRVPMFGGGGRGRPSGDCAWRRVTIENPCHPGERAEVLLGVDDCGNLVVCVRRDPPGCDDRRPPRPFLPNPCPPNPCPPSPCRPPRSRGNGCRGRLYGSWS